MKYLQFFFTIIFPLCMNAQDLMHSSHFHLETLDCPEGLVCESKTDDKDKLIFFQIFDIDGRLHSEYLRTSDSTFMYKAFHLMCDFTLIKKRSYYGPKVRGTLLISDTQIGEKIETLSAENFDSYKYHDTLLLPYGTWTIRDYEDNICERLKFNNQGEKQGAWDSYDNKKKTIERKYESDSLVNIHYVDEMSKNPEARDILKRMQGSWYVYPQWENKHMGHVAIGQKDELYKSKYAIYTIVNNDLKIESYEDGKKIGKTEKYKLTIKDNDLLVLSNKNFTVGTEVLSLSDDLFRLFQGT